MCLPCVFNLCVYLFTAKARAKECEQKFQPICSVRDNQCTTDFDCPGSEECSSDGCRLKCTSCTRRKFSFTCMKRKR